MKQIYFLAVIGLISLTSFGQTTLFQESFELPGGNGTRYTTSQTEFSDGLGDFFGRTDLNDMALDTDDLIVGTFYTLNATDGSFCFAAMDTDAANATGNGGPTTATLEFSAIDISAGTNMSLAFLIAEDDDNTNQDWDADTSFLVEINVDGAGFTPVFQVEAVGGTNTEPAVDTDFDGVGDGAFITNSFQEFAIGIPNGSLIDIRITFAELGSGDEDIAIDNIRIVDGFTASPTISTSSAIMGLNYEENNGPSMEGSFTVEGTDLTNDIVITPPANFEISTTSGGGFSNSAITLTQMSGAVAQTTLYARLAGGLAIGSYNDDVTITSMGATARTINLSGNVFAPATNSMIIVGVYDAQNNSAPKGIEVFVTANITDLSNFGIGTANNGGGTDGEEFTFPAGPATAGDTFFISSETTEFTAFFGQSPDFTSTAMGINGDDAIELFENGQVIDVFGDINVDGTGQPWDYVDGWAYRVNNTGPDGSNFVLANWSFSGAGTLDGMTDNASSTNPYPFESFVLSNNSVTINSFNIYPNPATSGIINISTINDGAVDIVIYSALGQEMIRKTDITTRLDISTLTSGLYLVRISQNGASQTRKLVVQ